MWSDRYDRVIEDIFDVQSDIAEKVTDQLNITLGDPERRAIEAKPTDNMDAYQAYLRGSECITSPDYTPENHRLAIQMFERAVGFDSGFAQAHALLSIAHSGMYFFGHDRTPDRAKKARTAIETAIALKRNDPETPLANGFYLYRCRTDFHGAIAEFRRAIQIQPNHSLAIFMVAMIQRRLGQFVESIAGVTATIKLDPMRSSYLCEAGITSFITRRFDDAIAYFNRSISLAPDQYNAYTWSAMLQLFALGDFKAARQRLEMIGERGLDEAFWEWYELLLTERDLSSTLAHIKNLKSELYEELSWYFPKSLMIAEAHALLGNSADAEPEFRKAMEHLDEAVASDPKDSRKRVAIATACVGLKRYEDAFTHIRAAVEIDPISKDAVTGPLVLSMQAIVHARAGDHVTALNIIEHLLSIPSWMSAGHLRAAPYWDSLRHLPEFQRLINLPPKVF